MSVISGDAYWAHVITPNTKFNPDGEWSIEVCNLNAKNKKVAEADGLTIKNKGDERGDFVTLKQYARTKDGMPRSVEVKDSNRSDFPRTKMVNGREVQNRIGNGSKVNASYFPKEYSAYGGGVKGYLLGVQVVDLVEYLGGGDEFAVVEDGYVNETDDIPFA